MAASETTSLKMIIVEDDKFMQSILQKYFSKFFFVNVFGDGIEALSFLHEGNVPDLIVTDLNTPKMSGLELIVQIKASDFFNSIPIMVVSGEESSEMIVKCLEVNTGSKLNKCLGNNRNSFIVSFDQHKLIACEIGDIAACTSYGFVDLA